MDERDGSCHRCRSTARAIGQQLEIGQIPVLSVDVARKIAMWCPVCRRVYCGKCCGASVGSVSLSCPSCANMVEFASVHHWKTSGGEASPSKKWWRFWK
jgi:hypothetical protein